MSIPERVFNISKSYWNRMRDRIDSELSGAEQELDSNRNPLSQTNSDSLSGSSFSDSDPEAMMRRAEERIASARRDLESRLQAARENNESPTTIPPIIDTSSETSPAPRPVSPIVPSQVQNVSEADPNFHDYRVLGVPVGGDLASVQSEYEKLSRRCDPRRFPEGSEEQKQAAQILARVNAAYESLHRRLDPTENRFGKLEFE